MTNSEPDAFGYRAVEAYPVAAVQVGEGKEGDTLMPAVVVRLRLSMRPGDAALNISLARDDLIETHDPEPAVSEQLVLRLGLNTTEILIDELAEWAEKARRRHWE